MKHKASAMALAKDALLKPEQIKLSSGEWRKRLTPLQYSILRNGGTESPGSHEYVHYFPKVGYFACAGCDLPLYSASAKFRDHGWPAWDKCFYSEKQGCHVLIRLGAEILCSRCRGHLGHVFFGERRTASNERH
mmetsp:Transcript_106333/g.193508  ORF Transcript_106333/g.193508 Transcript_106333/m.193508 type:complete len:134 (-) Transcript_106333:165-566(-)